MIVVMDGTYRDCREKVLTTFYRTLERFRNYYEFSCGKVSELAGFHSGQYNYDCHSRSMPSLEKAVLYAGAVKTSVSRALRMYASYDKQDRLPYFHLMESVDSQKCKDFLYMLHFDIEYDNLNDLLEKYLPVSYLEAGKFKVRYKSIAENANSRFWAAVANALKEKGVSQRQLAIKLGMDYPLLNKYMSQAYPHPGLDKIYAVATELSLDIDAAITEKADLKGYYDLFAKM